MRAASMLLLPVLLGLSSWSVAGQESQPPVVGGDADDHGCRASAGYVWCHRTDQCERPWELAQSERFENTGEAFREHCEGEDGFWLLQWCVSVGTARCEKTDRCENVEELAASEGFDPTPRAFSEFCRDG